MVGSCSVVPSARCLDAWIASALSIRDALERNGFVYTDTVAAAGVGRPSELDELDLAER